MIPSKNYYNHARRNIFEACSMCPATLLPLSFESKKRHQASGFASHTFGVVCHYQAFWVKMISKKDTNFQYLS
jgi:hypothetical protein